MPIVNLTQHAATDDQVAAGVIDLKGNELAALRDALTFDDIPSHSDLEDRASYVAELACYNGLGGDNDEDPFFRKAMIGGAPFFMPHLEVALASRGIEPVYAFSRRESVETHAGDGRVVKSAVFRHIGFVRGRAVPPVG